MHRPHNIVVISLFMVALTRLAPAQAKLRNAGKDCWNDCNYKQGPCSWCGTTGMCCKKGFSDKSNGCDGSFGGNARHECVKKGAAKLQNKGKDCWNDCNSKQGPCSWCGTAGMCCKKGFSDKSNGCDGTFGGSTRHECVLSGGSGSAQIEPPGSNSGWCDTKNSIGRITLEFQEKINKYRREHGRPPLTCNWILVKTAYSHVKDKIDYGKSFKKHKSGCNQHSWLGKYGEKYGARRCCFDKSYANNNCMWSKPKEISKWNDVGEGYEISYGANYERSNGQTIRSAVSIDRAIAGWKTSSGHNAVMVGDGDWGNLKEVGCYFDNQGDSGFADCWFFY